MMNEKIPFPSEEERNQSISRIVSTVKPQQHFLKSLEEMFRFIGIKGLFFGVEDSVFLALLCTIFGTGGTILCAMEHHSLTVILLFSMSPVLYGSLQVLTTWKELMAGTYEQKMVCKYTLRQVNFARMLFFGCVSIVICIGNCLLLSAAGIGTASVLRMLGISFAALFFFAAAELFAEWYCSVPAGHFVVPVLWSVLSVLLLLTRQWTVPFLMELPIVVFWLLAAVSAVVYAKLLHHSYFNSQEGAISYAVN